MKKANKVNEEHRTVASSVKKEWKGITIRRLEAGRRKAGDGDGDEVERSAPPEDAAAAPRLRVQLQYERLVVAPVVLDARAHLRVVHVVQVAARRVPPAVPTERVEPAARNGQRAIAFSNIYDCTSTIQSTLFV